MSTWSMFLLCGTAPTGEMITIFTSQQCINTVRNLHFIALMHSCGYFIVDFFYLAFVIRQHSDLDKQMYAHHLLALVTFYLTFVHMNWLVVVSVTLLFTEVSSNYICIRWLLYTHNKQDTAYGLVNAIAIFITFLFGRLIFQIIVIAGYGLPNAYYQFIDTDMEWWEMLILIEACIVVSLSIVLNGYWMYLITQ